MKQQVFRKHDIAELKNIVNKTDAQHIFLVRDKKSYFSSGADVFIKQLLEKNEQLKAFDDFEPNPQLSHVKKAVALFKKGTFELIIAIGGGSTLDMAKLISIFAHQEENFEDLIKSKNQLKEIKTPVLAIPTTSGSGAEATQFAVLYIDKTKYSVEHTLILPDYVYLSSEFSGSAKPYLTACTGLDAFCQAVESIWSIHSNAKSETFALKAALLVWDNLPKAVFSNDKTARENMQEAAYLAGKAINITKTTVSHALSYAFTSYYNIPHGHAVALSLPFFLKYNYEVTPYDCVDNRGPEAVKERIRCLLSSLNLSIDEAPEAFKNFFNAIEININISTLIKEFNPSLIAQNVNLQRLGNNPRKITSKVITAFFKRELNAQ
jgi:alcohol dehydrogenase class IV